MQFASLLFGFRQSVDRRTYVLVGFSLAALKYALDWVLVRAVTGQNWSLLAYLTPSLSIRNSAFELVPDSWLPWVMVAYTLPFAWIGLTMSVRRAADAGFSPWAGVWFVVPFANYILIAVLCVVGSDRGTWSPMRQTQEVPMRLANALMSATVGVLLSLGMLFVSAYILKEYGTSLFLGTPLVVGLVAGYLTNRHGPVSVGKTVSTASVAILLSAGVMLLFGIEGIVCIAMVLLPALAMAAAGAVVGRAIALGAAKPNRRGPPAAGIAALVLALPFVAGFEAVAPIPSPREVRSSVEIEAPPLAVWDHVIRFADLRPPDHWLFDTGVAYPVRARLEGAGVGAVRHCEFSTGPFIEPITRWEPGRVLSFDVEAQPKPMQEWSPYEKIHPPHLDGYFRSTRGEFRFIALPGGRTRLEGSTWYELDLAPFGYWSLIADQIVHQIHLRVLRHVKVETEKARSIDA
ncbi:MAG: SRPBCC family protein [Myxococcota bacterium]